MAGPPPIDRWHGRALSSWGVAAGATLLLLRLARLAVSRSEWNDLPPLTRANPILLTDDDAHMLTLLRIMLERCNLNVVSTQYGDDALALCHTMPISLVISDVMKPGMSGFDLLRQLRADPATRDIPLMFVSAGSSVQRIMAAKELGADDYLVKPVSFQELGKRVCALLAERGRWTVWRAARPASWPTSAIDPALDQASCRASIPTSMAQRSARTRSGCARQSCLGGAHGLALLGHPPGVRGRDVVGGAPASPARRRVAQPAGDGVLFDQHHQPFVRIVLVVVEDRGHQLVDLHALVGRDLPARRQPLDREGVLRRAFQPLIASTISRPSTCRLSRSLGQRAGSSAYFTESSFSGRPQ